MSEDPNNKPEPASRQDEPTRDAIQTADTYIHPWYVLLACAVALVQLRFVLLLFGRHYQMSVDAALGVTRGEPFWRIFQSRLMGPYLVKATSLFCDSFLNAHIFCSFVLLAVSGYLVLLVLTRLSGDRPRTLVAYLLFSFLTVFCLGGRWLYIWDLLDVFFFVLFNYFVIRRKDYRYFSVLFVAALFNRESAYYMAGWMILDPVFKYGLDRFEKRPARPFDYRMLLSGAVLLAVGIVTIQYLRSALVTKEVGHLIVGPVTGAGPHFHYVLPDNLRALKTAFTSLKPAMDFLIPLFWVAYAAFCARLASRDPRQHLAVSVIHVLLMGSALVFGSAFEPNNYLGLLPLVAVHLWTVIPSAATTQQAAPETPGDAAPPSETPKRTLSRQIKEAANSRRVLYGLVALAATGAAVVLLLNTVTVEKKPPAERKTPAAEETRAPVEPEPADPGPSPGHFTPEQTNGLIETLTKSKGSPVWFATYNRDPRAVALQQELEAVFRQAGWEVLGNRPVRFRLKPGVFFFMADAKPPQYALDALGALKAAGLELVEGSGYRAYSDEMKKKNPNWRGFDLALKQTFVIVVGPQP